jgi:hypothetical protein
MEATHLFVTDNLKLAIALTAAGFHIIHGEQLVKTGGRLLAASSRPATTALRLSISKPASRTSSIYQLTLMKSSRLGASGNENMCLAFDAAAQRCTTAAQFSGAIGKNRPLSSQRHR